jgi:hypothetical protein
VSLKCYCLVPAGWTAADCTKHSCDDRSHVHLSRRQLWELGCDGVVEWLHVPVNRRDEGIVRLCRTFGVRGLSCRVGPELADALRLGLAWACVMLADIRGDGAGPLR